MNYSSGTVFDRIGHAAADIGFYCMSANRQEDATKIEPSFLKSSEEARNYLRSLLFEATTDEKRAEWFKAVNQRISAINMMRAESGRHRVETMEKMLRELTNGDLITMRTMAWPLMQQLCGELGSVSRFIQNRIYEEMQDAVKPYKALLK